MAPLSLDPKPRATQTAAPTVVLDAEVEYRLVRRDLWRLTIYSVICFAAMILALLIIGA